MAVDTVTLVVITLVYILITLALGYLGWKQTKRPEDYLGDLAGSFRNAGRPWLSLVCHRPARNRPSDLNHRNGHAPSPISRSGRRIRDGTGKRLTLPADPDKNEPGGSNPDRTGGIFKPTLF